MGRELEKEGLTACSMDERMKSTGAKLKAEAKRKKKGKR